LSAAGVDQLVDLPAVGENLQDHVRITASYELKKGYQSPDELRLNATFAAEQLARWKNNQTGWYDETSSGYAYMQWPQAGYSQKEFVQLAEQSADKSNVVDSLKLKHLKNTGLRVPQLEVLFNDGYLGNKGYPAAGSPLYGRKFASFIASVNHAYSRGSTHINSSDATEHPMFNPMYLSKPFDLHAVASGAKYLRKIATSAPMKSAFVTEYEPGFNVVTTNVDWENYAKANMATIWHPMGTCAMLPKEDGGVVDSTLSVYGTSNLRVVDASIMPILISGHIQTAVYGIAERAAKMIAEQWG
jgi:choline dehydrogenase-like flavoprotein